RRRALAEHRHADGADVARTPGPRGIAPVRRREHERGHVLPRLAPALDFGALPGLEHVTRLRRARGLAGNGVDAVDRQHRQHPLAAGVGQAHGVAVAGGAGDPGLPAGPVFGQPAALLAVDDVDPDQGRGHGRRGRQQQARRQEQGGQAFHGGTSSRETKLPTPGRAGRGWRGGGVNCGSLPPPSTRRAMPQSRTRVLTGITTSGTPHLGNYVGAVRPAIASSRAPGTESFFFLADLHSLIKAQEPERTQRSTLEIAATWLAAGLDPARVWFYRQSDIPEITELTWFLTCVAGKGILNRAHAYKAAVDRNRAEGEDDDAGVTAGLFMYPVLMAADILVFNAHKVPVGRDQVQHIEMARDFGQRFNHVYGREWFTLPEAVVEEHVATLPGLDGRKMSKSYGNTIPLFAPPAELRRLVFSIVTDSRAPGEPKDTEGSALFQLYQAFATAEETAAFARAYAEGIGWGEAKQRL